MKKNSRGIFKQETNGKWMIDTTLTINGEYKHFKRRGYDTLASARADFELQKQIFIKKHSVTFVTMLFEDLVVKYEDMRKHKVNRSTLVCDNSVFNVYLLPYFKGKLIKDVFKQDVTSVWYSNLMANKEVSNNKKTKVIFIMKDLLKFTYDNRYIDAETYQLCDTHMFRVKQDKVSKQEREIWNADEEQRFLNATKENERDYLMFKILLHTGMRLSEFLGLQVKCFDYKKNKLVVMQQAYNITGEGLQVTNVLKSKESHRTVILNQELCDELNNYVDTLKLSDTDFLWFGRDFDTPMGKTSFRRKLKYYCEKADVKEIVPHAIRHSVAVKLARVCETTEDIEACASILGHTASVFLDIYANHKDDNKKASLLNKAFT